MKESFSPPAVVKVTVPKNNTAVADIGTGSRADLNVIDYEYSYDKSTDPRKVVPTEVLKTTDYHWTITFYNIHTSDIDITVNAVLVPKQLD